MLSKPNYQKLKTMEKGCMYQKIRVRSFEARNERIGTIVLVKTRLKEACQLSVESKRTNVYKEAMLAVSTKMRISAANNTVVLSCTKTADSKREKSSAKGKSPRGSGPSGKGSRKPCRDYFSGNCTSPRCNFWHPPE